MIAEEKGRSVKVEVCQLRRVVVVVEVLAKHTVMTEGVLILLDPSTVNKRSSGEVLLCRAVVNAL
jgi:hypothetical protein